jgi:hypothetical protein
VIYDKSSELNYRRIKEAESLNMDKTECSGYWMFVCNPKKWAIDRFFEAGIDKDTWGVRLSDAENFKPGHLALIRVGVDRRSKSERQDRPPLVAGIYAL